MNPADLPPCGLRFPDGVGCALIDSHEGPCAHPMGRWHWGAGEQADTVHADIAEAARLVHARRCLNGSGNSGVDLGRLLGEVLAIAAYDQHKATPQQTADIMAAASRLLDLMRPLRSWEAPVLNLAVGQKRQQKRRAHLEKTAEALETWGVHVDREVMETWPRDDVEAAWAWCAAMALYQQNPAGMEPVHPWAVSEMHQAGAGKASAGGGESATPAPRSGDASGRSSNTIRHAWVIVRDAEWGEGPDVIGVFPDMESAHDMAAWRWSGTDVPLSLRRMHTAREGDRDIHLVQTLWFGHDPPAAPDRGHMRGDAPDGAYNAGAIAGAEKGAQDA